MPPPNLQVYWFPYGELAMIFPRAARGRCLHDVHSRGCMAKSTAARRRLLYRSSPTSKGTLPFPNNEFCINHLSPFRQSPSFSVHTSSSFGQTEISSELEAERMIKEQMVMAGTNGIMDRSILSGTDIFHLLENICRAIHVWGFLSSWSTESAELAAGVASVLSCITVLDDCKGHVQTCERTLKILDDCKLKGHVQM